MVRLGLERSGWSCAFANDIDPKKLAMYRLQFPDADKHVTLGDIRQLNARLLPVVDLATASFPCTDLSLAGSRAGLSGEQSSALWPFLEILHKLDRMRPKLVLLENVPAFLTSNQGSDFKAALMALNDLGYFVDAFIVDAAHFVPQSRPRLFVIGTYEPDRSYVKTPLLAMNLESAARPAALSRFIKENEDIRWRIRDLPNLPIRSCRIDDVLETFPENAKEWWSEARGAYLIDQMSPRHRALADAMIERAEDSVGTVFRRVRNKKSMAELRTDGVAGCLRTPKGGSGRQILFVAGRGKFRARLLTPRECARLMGADEFPIGASSNQALFGFGDAVCVPVIDWIARNYLNPLLGELSPASRSFACQY